MKIKSYEFTDKWSWGLVMNDIAKRFSGKRIERAFLSDTSSGKIAHPDHIAFLQNATMLDCIDHADSKTIVRLGGNRTFMGNEDRYSEEMGKCFAVIATNKHLYDIAIRHNPNTVIIYNGLNLDKWKPVSDRKFVVGFCGNISKPQYREYKGIDIVESAIRILQLEGRNVELLCALYGKEQVPHDRMMEDFFHKINCIVHPTLGEGCSNTLMEACACGVPILTTKCAGMHGELMIDGDDCLFIERTAESIASAIRSIYQDRELEIKLSKGAREFAEHYHDIAKISDQYMDLFTKCRKANVPKPRIGYEINTRHKDWAHSSTVNEITKRLSDDYEFIDLSEPGSRVGCKVDAVWGRGGVLGRYKDTPFAWTCGTGGCFLKDFVSSHNREDAACVITQNEEAKEYLRKSGSTKPIFVIPNGVDIEKFAPPESRPARQFTAGFAARKDNFHKGWENFIPACNLASVEHSVCGYGDAERIPHDNMPAFYHGIDVFVQVSDAEGCSNAIMEAMACGLPCIIHRNSGYHAEACENYNQVLFATDTPEDVADKLNILKNNPDLYGRISRNAREFAKRHSWENLIHRHKAVFDYMLGYAKEHSSSNVPLPEKAVVAADSNKVKVVFREDVYHSGRKYFKGAIEYVDKSTLPSLGSKIKVCKR